jgi:Kelch motif/PQQ-like domain
MPRVAVVDRQSQSGGSQRGRTLGGARGNALLTSLTAAVLLVLLAVEGATIPLIRQLLSVHVFVGLLLLGPVALKLASTGYRFTRYYLGRADYVRLGPPAPPMRFVVAPILVLSTLVLFGTGVALVASPARGAVLTLHKASFIVWFGAMTLHVLAYVYRVGRHLVAEAARRVAGRGYRLALALAAVAAGIVAAVVVYPQAGPWFNQPAASGKGDLSSSLPPKTEAAPPAPPSAVESGLLPWRLDTPLSREIVLPRVGSRGLVVLGGLESGNSSTGAVDLLDTRNGALSPHGTLLQATHDAAGAALARRQLVIGGGTTAPARSTQITTGVKTAQGGALAGARADAGAVTIGRSVYVVGGYDGSAMDREVVATTDGRTYRSVAALPVAVRYPALAVLGSSIYVFGGLLANGHPTAAVQVIDPASRTARVVGRLPRPVDGAAAGVLNRTIYLAGGRTASGATTAIFAFDPRGASFLRAGSLRVAVANAGAAVTGGRLWLVGGETADGRPVDDVQMVVPNRAFGSAGAAGAGSPFFGSRLLVADRGNDRLLLLDDRNRVVWKYPARGRAAPRGGFYFPDDAFFIHDGRAIISNQEDNDTIVEIAYPSGYIRFRYGHPRTPGTPRGYLNTPDDTYLLRNGDLSVADAGNCRVLIIDPRTKRVLHQIGTPGRCAHDPPFALGSPNGDTPLADGNLLVSEINGSWIDELTLSGRPVWSVRLPIGYPSDPQQIGPDRYLVADYEDPGALVEFDRRGRIEYRYQPTSAPGRLDHPSLAELLPSGVFMVNDDYNDRMVAIDPATRAVVWQYGVTGRPGTAPGRLNTPDGFDLLAPAGRTPTHPTTG